MWFPIRFVPAVVSVQRSIEPCGCHVRLSPGAVIPQRGSTGAAGYDLSRWELLGLVVASAASVTNPMGPVIPSLSRCSAHAAVVPARGKELVKTDLSIAVPPGNSYPVVCCTCAVIVTSYSYTLLLCLSM